MDEETYIAWGSDEPTVVIYTARGVSSVQRSREGLYVNDPLDSGGPTKYGITIPTLTDANGTTPLRRTIPLLLRTV